MYVSAHDMAFAHTQGHDRMFAWEGKGGGSCACASLGNSPEAKRRVNHQAAYKQGHGNPEPRSVDQCLEMVYKAIENYLRQVNCGYAF
jgi:hypothetical protein